MNGRNVLVLPAWYPSAAEPRASPFIRDHARAAASYGHRMIVLAETPPSSEVDGVFKVVTEHDEKLTVVRLTIRPGLGRFVHLPAILAISRGLAREGLPVEIVHAHAHRMAWPAALAGTILRRPIVVSEHSSDWSGDLMTPGALVRARMAFSRTALICPISKALEEKMRDRGIRADFRIVPEPLDTAVFHLPDKVVRTVPTRLINVARHVPIKGLDVLLRAFRVLLSRRPELTLDLVGDGPLTPGLRSLAAELGLAHSVRFLGPLRSARSVADLLRSSHVFVLSSLYETQSVAVVEALCCGLPVAATRVGGLPEVVGDGNESALARPNDPEALAGAVEAILDRYQNLDRAAFARRTADRFSLDAIGKMWDEIYRSL